MTYICGKCGPVEDDPETHKEMHRAEYDLVSEATGLLNPPLSWWYLSFVDEGGWLGGAFVEGYDLVTAVRSAWSHGCNPGGAIAFAQIDHAPPEGYTNRLLSRKEIESLPPPFGYHRPTSTEASPSSDQ